MIATILFYILVAAASLLTLGAAVFFAWYCSTNGGQGY